MARPPIPNGRLRILDDDRVEFTLKRPRRGVRQLIFDPIALLGRMAALIPRPKTNLVLYFGCLSAASPIYRAVVPAPPDPTPSRPVAPPRPKVMRHADLIARVFLTDILSCPCGGRLDVVRAVSHPGGGRRRAGSRVVGCGASGAHQEERKRREEPHDEPS